MGLNMARKLAKCYFQVFNVKEISLPFDIEFSNYHDHSKFAVSTDVNGGKNDAWVCIGDINRQVNV